MPEKHSGPAMPGGTERPYVKPLLCTRRSAGCKDFQYGGGVKAKPLPPPCQTASALPPVSVSVGPVAASRVYVSSCRGIRKKGD